MSSNNRFAVLDIDNVDSSAKAKAQPKPQAKPLPVAVAALPCSFEENGRTCPYHPLNFSEGGRKKGVPCPRKHRLLPVCPHVRAQVLCPAANPLPGESQIKCPFYHPQVKPVVHDDERKPRFQRGMPLFDAVVIRTVKVRTTHPVPAPKVKDQQPTLVEGSLLGKGSEVVLPPGAKLTKRGTILHQVQAPSADELRTLLQTKGSGAGAA